MMMYRARIEFSGGAIFYSVEKATERAVRETLYSIGDALNYVKKITLQEHSINERIESTRGSGWYDMQELRMPI